jgi:hypothetical protein
MSTFTRALLREFACFSDLICSSIRSLTRRASASFASRTAHCSEVSFAGGSSARDSGSVESSERAINKLTIERNRERLLCRSTEWTVGWARETCREAETPEILWAFYGRVTVCGRSIIGCSRALVAPGNSTNRQRGSLRQKTWGGRRGRGRGRRWLAYNLGQWRCYGWPNGGRLRVFERWKGEGGNGGQGSMRQTSEVRLSEFRSRIQSQPWELS